MVSNQTVNLRSLIPTTLKAKVLNALVSKNNIKVHQGSHLSKGARHILIEVAFQDVLPAFSDIKCSSKHVS